MVVEGVGEGGGAGWEREEQVCEQVVMELIKRSACLRSEGQSELGWGGGAGRGGDRRSSPRLRLTSPSAAAARTPLIPLSSGFLPFLSAAKTHQ